MTEIISITLENEMDLVLAYKRSMRLGERIGLTLATQTAFATAVSEVARVVIEHTNAGVLQLGIHGTHPKFNLGAAIVFDREAELSQNHEGLFYAKKLIPEFSYKSSENNCLIKMSIGLPRSLKMDKVKILDLFNLFKEEAPLNAYEEIKNRNNFLNKITTEQELEIRQEKLINEKKNEFISIASHEIKTPITVLKAYTQMLRKLSDRCEPKVSEIVEKLDIQTSKLTVLVQQLMDVSQIENGSLSYNKEELNFNPFIKDVVSVLEHIHNKHTILLKLSEDIKISADRLRLEQVFTNLIGNAAKYSETGTNITLECSSNSEQFNISIRDQGLGMSPETLGSIFKKFYRDSDVLTTHSGLGMGLFITSKIILDHGGKIWVESEQGQGSIFHVSIPYLTK